MFQIGDIVRLSDEAVDNYVDWFKNCLLQVCDISRQESGRIIVKIIHSPDRPDRVGNNEDISAESLVLASSGNQKCEGFVQVAPGTFCPMPKQPIPAPKLSSGVYELGMEKKQLFFKEITTLSDELLDIPDPTFKTVVDEMKVFFNKETKRKFSEYGYVYKRSALLYGEPGVGKTCCINRIINEVKSNGGIVLFNPNPGLLQLAYEVLDDLQPESLTLVIFEELDELLEDNESALLNLLDGEIQKDNVVYLATTNFIDEIPNRIKRPGRFSTVIEMGAPCKEGREFYLSCKLLEEDLGLIPEIVEKTEGFTIDELKEVVLSVCCLGTSVDTVVKKIAALDKSEKKSS